MLKSAVMLNGPLDMTKAFGCVCGSGRGGAWGLQLYDRRKYTNSEFLQPFYLLFCQKRYIHIKYRLNIKINKPTDINYWCNCDERYEVIH